MYESTVIGELVLDRHTQPSMGTNFRMKSLYMLRSIQRWRMLIWRAQSMLSLWSTVCEVCDCLYCLGSNFCHWRGDELGWTEISVKSYAPTQRLTKELPPCESRIAGVMFMNVRKRLKACRKYNSWSHVTSSRGDNVPLKSVLLFGLQQPANTIYSFKLLVVNFYGNRVMREPPIVHESLWNG